MAQPEPVATAVASEETVEDDDEETSMDEADALFTILHNRERFTLHQPQKKPSKHFSHPMDLNCSRKLAPIQPQSMTNAVENSSR